MAPLGGPGSLCILEAFPDRAEPHVPAGTLAKLGALQPGLPSTQVGRASRDPMSAATLRALPVTQELCLGKMHQG